MCKLIYGLTTIKEGEEDPFKGKNNGEDEDNDKEGEAEKEKEGSTVKETQQKEDEMATAEEQQTDQSVQDTQLPPLRPPHDTNTPVVTIKVKDVPDNSNQNINPLIIEDLKKILDQSTLQAKLCDNPVLVNVDEQCQKGGEILKGEIYARGRHVKGEANNKKEEVGHIRSYPTKNIRMIEDKEYQQEENLLREILDTEKTH